MFIGDGEGDAEMLYHVLVLKFTFPKTEGTKSFFDKCCPKYLCLKYFDPIINNKPFGTISKLPYSISSLAFAVQKAGNTW